MLFVIIAFSFIPASFAVFVVKEREINAKHQQLISGVSIPAYWLSTFAWDIMNYMLPCILSIILIIAFDIKQLTTGDALAATILLFLEYGMSVAVSPSQSALPVCIVSLLSCLSTAKKILLTRLTPVSIIYRRSRTS